MHTLAAVLLAQAMQKSTNMHTRTHIITQIAAAQATTLPLICQLMYLAKPLTLQGNGCVLWIWIVQ